MNDTLTIRGIVATPPRHLVTNAGLAITSFRLASPSRRWDRASSSWMNGDTNWFTVTAFRSLATNIESSLVKGDRVVVVGRLRVRAWERDARTGVAVEIDAESLGHDLAWGTSTWRKTPRNVADETAAPGESPSSEDRAVAGSLSGSESPIDAPADRDLSESRATGATGAAVGDDSVDQTSSPVSSSSDASTAPWSADREPPF